MPVPPQPPPLVPELEERKLQGTGHALAPGAALVQVLDEEYALGLSPEKREELGKILETDLYPRLN